MLSCLPYSRLAQRCLGLALILLAALAADARRTDLYKPGEYAPIGSGASPDHRFVIAAHGDGEGGEENFHLYLLAEPGHKKLGVLSEVTDTFEYGTADFVARWSPDSRHVAVSYQVVRHIGALLLYRIANRRAHPVPLPRLINIAKGKPRGGSPPSNDYYKGGSDSIRWLSATRFVLNARHEWRGVPTSDAHRSGSYYHAEKDENGTTRTIIFAAEAVCELRRSDHCRVVSMKPDTFGG